MRDIEKLKTPPKSSVDAESRIFDRILNRTIEGIAGEGTRFKLENSYYVNEKDTILLRSTQVTGRFFKKAGNDRQQLLLTEENITKSEQQNE